MRITAGPLVFVFASLTLACSSPSDAESSGSAGEESTSSTDTGADAGGSSGFTDGGDDGTNGGECILYVDGDCAAGEKCMPWSAADDRIPDTNKCCPVDGMPGGPGDACTITDYDGSCMDDCEAGTMCVLDDQDGLTGICQRFCDPNDQAACGDTEVCKAFFEMIEEAATVPLCMSKCDPLLQNCQALGRPGWSCLPEGLSDPDFLCTPPPPQPKQEFEGCILGNDCEPGLACTHASTVVGCPPTLFCCTSFCDLTEPNQCTGGNECISLGVTDPAFDHVGLCGIPE